MTQASEEHLAAEHTPAAVRRRLTAPPQASYLRDFIYGATIETTFDAREIADRVLAVRLVFEGKEILRGAVDFTRLD